MTEYIINTLVFLLSLSMNVAFKFFQENYSLHLNTDIHTHWWHFIFKKMELFKNASFCHALNKLSFSLKVIQNIICSFQISLSIYVLYIYIWIEL